MSHEGILLTLAEVSVAFVGFSALVVAFRRGNSDLRARETERIRAIIGTGLSALLFSTLPFALFAFDLSETATWRIGSALQAAVHVTGASASVIQARRLGAVLRLTDVIFIGVGGAVILLLVLNAAGVGLNASFGPYLVGVMWLLGVSAFMLSGLVTRPQHG